MAENIIYGRTWPLLDSLNIREEKTTPFLLDAGLGKKQKIQPSSSGRPKKLPYVWNSCIDMKI